jgi:hypothetical protein
MLKTASVRACDQAIVSSSSAAIKTSGTKRPP